MKQLLKDQGLWCEGAYVGGVWIASSPYGCYTLRNPADDNALVDLPRFKEAETAAAVEVAHEAFLSWRKTETDSFFGFCTSSRPRRFVSKPRLISSSTRALPPRVPRKWLRVPVSPNGHCSSTFQARRSC
jgi:hypothetical protein